MDIKVTKNEWEIISSGYLLVIDGEFVDFSIEGLLFRLKFEKKEGEDTKVGYGIIKNTDKPDYMEIKCQNFDKSMFRTVNEPLLLAKKDGRDIAFQFSVSSIFPHVENAKQVEVSENKILFYCWSIGPLQEEKPRGKAGDGSE